jgi:RNA 2',3'-cyclic 3'-phosphodiesterase
MARSRIFLALDVGPAVRTAATTMQRTLAATGVAVKWVDPATMHLTLVYLGDIDDRDLAEVCKLAKHAVAKLPEFKVAVGGLGAFPTPRRPKILWADITAGREEIANLFLALEVPLSAAGLYRKEDRPYTPHLTLGRVTDDAADALATEIPRLAAWSAGSFPVEEVLVLQSEIRRGGPEYSVVGRVNLGG